MDSIYFAPPYCYRNKEQPSALVEETLQGRLTSRASRIKTTQNNTETSATENIPGHETALPIQVVLTEPQT
jgi:hypothetical protein